MTQPSRLRSPLSTASCAPLRLCYWDITPAEEDRFERSRVYRLHQRGWKGICVANFSAIEEGRMTHSLRGKGASQVYRSRIHVNEEYVPDFGEVMTESRSFYFQDPEDLRAFEDLIDDLPERSHELVLKQEPDMRELAEMLRGRNWGVFHPYGTSKGHGPCIISYEDGVEDDEVMMIKMKYG